MSTLFSRRRMISAAIGGTIASALCAAGSRADSSADNQLQKEDVRYQDRPKGAQRCNLCVNFLSPSGCRVVAGHVSPDGWCLLFKPNTH